MVCSQLGAHRCLWLRRRSSLGRCRSVRSRCIDVRDAMMRHHSPTRSCTTFVTLADSVCESMHVEPKGSPVMFHVKQSTNLLLSTL